MKRNRLPSAVAVCVALGLAGSLAVTACGTVTQTGRPAAAQSGALTSASASAPATHAPPAGPGPSPAAASRTVVVECLQNALVKPVNFILTCADANSVLARLAWTSWTPEQAVATGVHELNDCVPDCAMGKFRDYPAVVTLWRGEPAPGHAGERYFTRITVRYTGPRPPAYMSNGKLIQNPSSWTQALAFS